MIQTLHDTGDDYQILSSYDGGVYATGISDCVCKGIGDEFDLTGHYSADSLNISFSAGSQAVIGGSFFRVTSLESITLSANATIYLCANINLSNPNGSKGSFVQRTSSNMQTDNINGSGTSRDLLLYIITTGANGVISVQDKRIIRGDGTAVSGLGITLNATTETVADSSYSFTETVNASSFSFQSSTGQFNGSLATKDLQFSNANASFKFKVLTQAQYNAISTKDANTLYVIVG